MIQRDLAYAVWVPLGMRKMAGERRRMAEKVVRQAFSCIYQVLEPLRLLKNVIPLRPPEMTR